MSMKTSAGKRMWLRMLIVAGLVLGASYVLPRVVGKVKDVTGRQSLKVLPQDISYLRPAAVNAMGVTLNNTSVRQSKSNRLTASELFGKRERNPNYFGITFNLQGIRESDCASGVWGAKLQNLLKQGQCARLIRGLYRRSDGGAAGLVGTLDLMNGESAREIALLVSSRKDSGFVHALKAERERVALGPGYSEAQVSAIGHYVVIIWVCQNGHESAVPRNDEFDHSFVALEQVNEPVSWQVNRSGR